MLAVAVVEVASYMLLDYPDKMRQWYLVLEGIRATLVRPPLGPRNAKMSQ